MAVNLDEHESHATGDVQARVQRAEDAGRTALTMLRARAFLKVFPDFGPAWFRLGKALTNLARYEEAEQALQKAIEHCPQAQLWAPFGAMGHLFRTSGDFSQAEEWYQRRIAVDPDDASGYIFLGALLASQGRLPEAEDIHRKGTLCAEGCIDEAFLNLGLVLRAQGRFAEAAECFEEGIRLDPNYRHAKRALRDVMACMRESETNGRA